MSLRNSNVTATSLSTDFTTIWSADQVLVYALLRLSSDEVEVSIHNGGVQVMFFDLPAMKTSFKVDTNTLTDPIIQLYSSGRWCLDLRKLDGLYPQGVVGVEIKLRAKSGTKTLDSAMIIAKDR